jgi:hypothetical protein
MGALSDIRGKVMELQHHMEKKANAIDLKNIQHSVGKIVCMCEFF